MNTIRVRSFSDADRVRYAKMARRRNRAFVMALVLARMVRIK